MCVSKDLILVLKHVVYLAQLRKKLEKYALTSITFFPVAFTKRTIFDEDKLYAPDTCFNFEILGKKIGYIARQTSGNEIAFSHWKACVYGVGKIVDAEFWGNCNIIAPCSIFNIRVRIKYLEKSIRIL